MKLSFLGSVLILFGSLACSKHAEQAPPPPPAPQKSIDSLVSDGGTAAPAPPAPATAGAVSEAPAPAATAADPGSNGERADVIAINRAIDAYVKQTGKEPTKLEDLVAKGFLPSLPKPPPGMKLRYDFAAVRAFMVVDNGGK